MKRNAAVYFKALLSLTIFFSFAFGSHELRPSCQDKYQGLLLREIARLFKKSHEGIRQIMYDDKK